jgi:hypothetical protein
LSGWTSKYRATKSSLVRRLGKKAAAGNEVATHVDADRHLDHHAQHALEFVQADILAPSATSCRGVRLLSGTDGRK